MSREKTLVKNTAIIALGKISTQFVSFLLLPLYTAILTTEEYGIVDLFTTYSRLLLPILTLMIEHGAFRYLLSAEVDKHSKAEIVTNSFIVITGMNILFALGECVLFQVVYIPYSYYLVPILIASSYSSWLLQIARGVKMTTLYSFGSFVSATIHIIMNVILIAVLHKGVQGMLVATVIGHVSCAFLLTWRLKIYRYIDFSVISKNTIKRILTYSIPLIPNAISLWIINSSDRTIVNYFLGTEANGVLAVSHKFPTIFQTVFSIFLLSWQEFATIHWNDPDWESFFNSIFEKIFKIFSAICIIIISVLPFVFPLLVNKSFSQAYDTIPIYMIAMLLNILIGLIGVVYVATRNTKEIAKTTIVAGIINVIVHLIIIKFFGLYAAALSTFIAYLCAAIYRFHDTKRIIRIHMSAKTICLLLFSIIIAIFCYYQNSYIWNAFGIFFTVCFCLYFCKDTICVINRLLRKVLKK